MTSLELKVPPLAVVIIIGGVMVGVGRMLPMLSFVIAGRPFVAIALAATGAAIAAAGVIAFRAHRTTVNPLVPGDASSIVSTGVYGFSRNPMYLGFGLALGGWAVYLANAASMLLLLLYSLYMSRFQIEPEERILLSKFGAEFEQYMKRVRRWL